MTRRRCGLLPNYFKDLLFLNLHHTFGTGEARQFEFRVRIGLGEC